MSRYSIKELEKLSGIKAHTIRIWEKRYKIIAPERTPTNIRFYSDEDLKKIINVALLNNHGLKISKIADLTIEQIFNRVTELSNASTTSSVSIDQLIVAMVDLDEAAFTKVLKQQIAADGMEKAIIATVYPFLEKIGILWQTGNIAPAQEHFISNLIRQKIIVAIDSLSLPPKDAPCATLFLPDGELHELSLLFYHYVARKTGFRTYYLGQMVPYADVLSVSKNQRPAVLITSIISTSAERAPDYLLRLCQDHPRSTVLASGRVLQKVALKIPKNLHLFFTVSELQHHLRVVKSR